MPNFMMLSKRSLEMKSVLFFLLFTASQVFGGDQFDSLQLGEDSQLQIGAIDYGSESWMISVSRGIGRWEMTIHRGTNPKSPVYIELSDDVAKSLIAEGVSVLYDFKFSDKGRTPPGDESDNHVRLTALNGRERLQVFYFRGIDKNRYSKLENLLAKISKWIPDEYSQYRLK